MRKRLEHVTRLHGEEDSRARLKHLRNHSKQKVRREAWCSVEFEDLTITSFHAGGVFATWNEHNPSQRVHVGSRILEANGKSELTEKLKELKDATHATAISLKIECCDG